MTLWLVRAGRHGEHEQRFLDEGNIYLTWGHLNCDLSTFAEKPSLRETLTNLYPDFAKGKISNNLGQIWGFSHGIKNGDWIVLPSKHKPAIHVGEVTGDYTYHANAENPFYHSRTVKWFATDIPRSRFDQDLLYSFGAFMTVCQISRNDAEPRIHAMAKSEWRTTKKTIRTIDDSVAEEVPDGVSDLEQVARDQIAKLIQARFKGHGMARLVEAVLKAEDYTTHVSPPGPDKGIDILAAPGALGFGTPRICVQVKSGDTPLDRPTLDQLIGVMQNAQAEQGLLVSWGGFKSSVDKERAAQFFRVRLWDQDDFIEQLLSHYERLDDDLRAELPLKRIWTIAETDGDD